MRHALDSPWVESRMDVLVVVVSIMVRHILPIICEVGKSGLFPPQRDLKCSTELSPGLCARCIVKLTSRAKYGYALKVAVCGG